ncbi:hypothetical protein PZH32_02875 [Adlercreutzia equolifaciens]|nr:hypothetical protein [Adlercreutzia equolifaciens]MDE8701900.1 hypothetical protein [Adlercreutzia equolifaciens]
MARLHPDLRPVSPAASIALMLLAIVSFLIALWIIMALVRIVFG